MDPPRAKVRARPKAKERARAKVRERAKERSILRRSLTMLSRSGSVAFQTMSHSRLSKHTSTKLVRLFGQIQD